MTCGAAAFHAFTAGAAAAVVLTLASPALARPSLPRLSEFRFDGPRVSFRQPDGTATTIDVRTGKVLQRGGDLHDDWTQPRECSIQGTGTCPFASGVLVLRHDKQPATTLEGAFGGASWKAFFRDYMSSSLRRVWEVDDKLLMESPSYFDIMTLECIDQSSGLSLWIYAYPSPSMHRVRYVLWDPDGDAFERARQKLRDFEDDALEGALLGTVAGVSEDAAWGPYQGTVVLDPDPLAVSAVRKRIMLGSVALVVMLTGLAMVLFLPAGKKRSVLLVLLVAALGLMVIVGGDIDRLFTLGLWGGFLAAFIAAHGRGKGGAHDAGGKEGPASVLRSCLTTALISFVIVEVALWALDALLRTSLGFSLKIIASQAEAFLLGGGAIAFVAFPVAIQATRRVQDTPSRAALWMIMAATVSLSWLQFIMAATTRY